MAKCPHYLEDMFKVSPFQKAKIFTFCRLITYYLPIFSFMQIKKIHKANRYRNMQLILKLLVARKIKLCEFSISI